MFIPKGTIYCPQCNSMVVKICHADLSAKDKKLQIEGCKNSNLDKLVKKVRKNKFGK